MNRYWCAVIQYPGKRPVIYGSTMVEANAPTHYVEQLLRESISRHLPDGWKIVNMVPGALWFAEEAENGA